MKSIRIVFVLLLAAGCGGTPSSTSDDGSPGLVEATAAGPSPSATAINSQRPVAVECPAALLDGRLEEHNGELVAVNGAETARLVWEPTQYRVLKSGDMFVVEDSAGRVVAQEGDVVTLSGGFVGAGGEWLVCGGVDVRGPLAEPTRLSTPAEATPSPFEPSGEIEIVDYGFSTYRDVFDDGEHSVSWAVVVENSSTDGLARHVDVVVSLLDSSGDPVEVVTDTWDAILPGQSAALADSITVIESGVLHTITAMNVEIVDTGRWAAFSGTPGSFSFSEIRTRRDSIRSVETKAEVSSTFAEDTAALVVAIYRNRGAIVGGAHTYTENLPAFGQLALEIEGPRGLGRVDQTELFAHPHLPDDR